MKMSENGHTECKSLPPTEEIGKEDLTNVTKPFPSREGNTTTGISEWAVDWEGSIRQTDRC